MWFTIRGLATLLAFPQVGCGRVVGRKKLERAWDGGDSLNPVPEGALSGVCLVLWGVLLEHVNPMGLSSGPYGLAIHPRLVPHGWAVKDWVCRKPSTARWQVEPRSELQ